MDNLCKSEPDGDGRVAAEVEDVTASIPVETNAEVVFGRLKSIIQAHGGKAVAFVRTKGPAFDAVSCETCDDTGRVEVEHVCGDRCRDLDLPCMAGGSADSEPCHDCGVAS